jgi:hypothetical protein
MANLQNIDLSVSENNQNNFTNILIGILVLLAAWMFYTNYIANQHKNNTKASPKSQLYQETPVIAPTIPPQTFSNINENFYIESVDNIDNINNDNESFDNIDNDNESFDNIDNDNESFDNINNDIESFENIDNIEYFDNINDINGNIEPFINIDNNQVSENIHMISNDNVEHFVNMNSDKYELTHNDSASPFSINNITPMVDEKTEIKTNCNIVNSDIIKDYKKKYFGMYAHQMGCKGSEGCNQSTDANSMNFYTLEMNKNKSCSTCVMNQPILDRPSYNKLSKDIQAMDNDVHNQQQITQANISNFVNFENNVYQNSIGETQVDKMAEIRTNVGTCGLSEYGTTIAQVYDNLLSTVSGETLNNSNPDPSTITGILDDLSYSNNFELV